MGMLVGSVLMQFVGVGFRQNGFFADLYFWAAGFLAGFFRLIFVGKSAQKNPPGKSPEKSSKNYTTKIPDTFLQRGRAKVWPKLEETSKEGVLGAS